LVATSAAKGEAAETAVERTSTTLTAGIRAVVDVLGQGLERRLLATQPDSWGPWNNMSDPGAFAAAGAEEQQGGEPPPLAGAGVVVCLMG
jgi:hypothetical protein